METRTCPACGGPVTGRPNKVYCERRCYRLTHMRRTKGIEPPQLDRPCGHCSKTFRSHDGRQDYCTDTCMRTAKSLRQVRRLYGIAPSDYLALVERQGGVCAICRQPERTERNRLLTVDHCHQTGQVRGLLCSQCNRAIGLLGDDPKKIRAAAAYVESNTQLRLII